MSRPQVGDVVQIIDRASLVYRKTGTIREYNPSNARYLVVFDPYTSYWKAQHHFVIVKAKHRLPISPIFLCEVYDDEL